MKEMTIRLSQLEKTDLPRVKEFFNSGFKRFINDHKEYGKHDIEGWFSKISEDHSSIYFAIRGSENTYRNFLVGVCGLQNIDWVARHAELFFIMIDKDGPQATMHDRPATKSALIQALDFSFQEINLNKVWIEVYEHNNIKEVLETFGFVAEGVKKASLFKEGKFLDSIICSLTAGEHRDRHINRRPD